MNKILLFFSIFLFGTLIKSDAQQKWNKNPDFMYKLSQDAKLIVTKFLTKKLRLVNENEFVELMEMAADNKKWGKKNYKKYIAGFRTLSKSLNLSANTDDKGEIFVKGTKATYEFYENLFKKFTITRQLMQDNKLLLID